ncbi:hypothetical protein N7488_011298 [Penicillium malachiteum]|nr:hypothetical protein N7488_011298 [Penicillium malachiteum]
MAPGHNHNHSHNMIHLLPLTWTKIPVLFFAVDAIILRQGSRRMVLEDRDGIRHHMFRMFSDSIARLMLEIQPGISQTQPPNPQGTADQQP